MFQKNTVFIIGAGASFEVGLPLGTELKSRIADALRFRFERFKGQTDGDYELFDALKQKYGDRAGAYTTAGSELSKVIPTFPSMDEALNYFSSRPEVIETGKIAIVAEILRSEQNSALRINPQIGRPDPNAADSTWLGHFFSIAMSSIKQDDIENIFSKVTFINFNYDRVLEHFLFWALQSRALVKPDVAASIVGQLKIIRPYGAIGPLNLLDGKGLPFGDFSTGRRNLFDLAKGIRTYTEQCASEIPISINEELDTADAVVIIGFGFHPQNMSLLQPLEKRVARSTRVFATAKDIDLLNHPDLLKSLSKAANSREVKLLDMTGSELLSKVRPSISGATS